MVSSNIYKNATDLAPFWDSPTTFWQSDKLFSDAKHYYNADKLGYTYPDLADVDRTQPAVVQSAAKESVKTLLAQTPASMFNVNADNADVDQWYNWTIRTRCKKFELGRSFTILILVGDVPKDQHTWAKSENLVGVQHVFANRAAEECGNCSSNPDLVHEGFVHLNRYLIARVPEYKTFDPEHVKPYLQKNLHWGTVDVSDIPIIIVGMAGI